MRSKHQSRLGSATEQILNVGSGFIISACVFNWIISPLYDLKTTTHENLSITLIFTVISIVRGYVWRRVFNEEEKDA